MKRIVFMFSGQGAQYYQMGRELFDADPVFRRWMHICDALARPVIGANLTEIIYGNTLAESAGFDRLLHTHPALLAQGYSLAQALKCRGIEPDYVLGYSLGELIGAVLAGAISLQDGFALVLEQARLVECTTPPARMVAVLSRPELMQEQPKLFAGCTLSAVNFDRHFVVTMEESRFENLTQGLTRQHVTWAALPVRYGFHSGLLDPLEAPLRQFVSTIELRRSTVPMVPSDRAEERRRLDGDQLWRMVRAPIRFGRSVDYLYTKADCVYLDLGPSGTLASFVRQILGPGVETYPALNAYGQDSRTVKRITDSLILLGPQGKPDHAERSTPDAR